MGNKTRIRKEKNGQYRTTVPVGLADAMSLDGKRVEWRVKSGNKLEVEIIDE